MADDDYTPRYDTTPIILVDRALTGGFEYTWNGRPFVFKQDKPELLAWADHARHIFKNRLGQLWVWPKTEDGSEPAEMVCRVAIKAAPGFEAEAEQLIAELGPESADDSPIEIDTQRRDRTTGEVLSRIQNIPLRDLLANHALANARVHVGVGR